MLIRSKAENALIDFRGTGLFWTGGYLCCACSGVTVKLKSTKEYHETSNIVDEIQEAFIRGEKVIIIE